jgi:hypothetical protein
MHRFIQVLAIAETAGLISSILNPAVYYFQLVLYYNIYRCVFWIVKSERDRNKYKYRPRFFLGFGLGEKRDNAREKGIKVKTMMFLYVAVYTSIFPRYHV